ncbi:hypothetical protein [Rhizobium sp. Rhizsp82]|uniref:hypothetical protein n=1 Tax=Rhizobium sp. Rhizsp82 TaxID=3243057 RepID=UPI0039B64126
MMEHIEPERISDNPLTKVWAVADFCARHRINSTEMERLIQLFGPFASASELLHNARRDPKFR